MAMLGGAPDEGLVSDINVTPLVDVMLVLLTVFIVTAPLLMNAVKVKLPQANADMATSEIKTVHVSVTQNGEIFLDEQLLPVEALTTQLTVLKKQGDPAVEIYADTHAQYGVVAKVMAAVQRAGVSKFSFVMSPEAAHVYTGLQSTDVQP